MNVYSDFTIPAFGRHVTIFSHEFMRYVHHHFLFFIHHDEESDEMMASVMFIMEIWITASYFAVQLRNIAEHSLLAGS
jgi:hypothetical protein